MKYMLDTNICIYIIKNKPPEVLEKFSQLKVGEICVSSITFSELCAGVEKSFFQDKNKAALDKFFSAIDILDYNKAAAQCYGKIRAHLEKQGTPIGAYDMMIGAHALSLGFTLVTNNTMEFRRIDGLQIENWV